MSKSCTAARGSSQAQEIAYRYVLHKRDGPPSLFAIHFSPFSSSLLAPMAATSHLPNPLRLSKSAFGVPSSSRAQAPGDRTF